LILGWSALHEPNSLSFKVFYVFTLTYTPYYLRGSGEIITLFEGKLIISYNKTN